MKFEHQYDLNSPKITIEIPNDVNIDEVMQAFHGFLLACTFQPKTISHGLLNLLSEVDDSINTDSL